MLFLGYNINDVTELGKADVDICLVHNRLWNPAADVSLVHVMDFCVLLSVLSLTWDNVSNIVRQVTSDVAAAGNERSAEKGTEKDQDNELGRLWSESTAH